MPARAAAMAEVAGLREVALGAVPRFDVTPKSGGRFHVAGRVRARIGQTCVVTLEEIENEIDEPIDLIFAPPEQIPQMAALVDEAEESDEETPDPPEPIVNGIIDLGRARNRRAVSRDRSLSAQAGCGLRACRSRPPIPRIIHLPRSRR